MALTPRGQAYVLGMAFDVYNQEVQEDEYIVVLLCGDESAYGELIYPTSYSTLAEIYNLGMERELTRTESVVFGPVMISPEGSYITTEYDIHLPDIGEVGTATRLCLTNSNEEVLWLGCGDTLGVICKRGFR